MRSYPTRRYPEGKVGVAALQRLLRNPYYAGQLVYKRGTPDEQVFEGRHPRLIDQATFDLVQTRLDEKRLAGERPQKRRHYLRGSVFCGDCGHRLIYGFSRGKSGQRYPYFFCVSRTRGSNCEMHTSISPKLIEQAIERFYRDRPVQLNAEQVRRRTEAIEALVAVSQQAVSQIKDAKTRLIRALEAKQDALVDMRFSEKSISASVFKRKQAALDDELEAAHASLAETEGALQLNATHLRIALELAEAVAAVYQGGDQQLKRGYNQAFFRKLYVTPEWDEAAGQMAVRITGAELTEPYALLLADDLAEDMLAEAEAIKAQAAQRAPESQPGSPKPLASGCSIFVKMAEPEEVEPLVDMADPALLDRQAQAHWCEHAAELRPERFGVRSGAGDHHDEIIRIADESIGRDAFTAPLGARPARAERFPLAREVLVQHRQCDVGQQRREDPALRGAGVRGPVEPGLGKNPRGQERPDQTQHALVRDPRRDPIHQGTMVDLVKARRDVRLEHPFVIPIGRSEMVDLGDRVLGSPLRAKAIAAWLEVRLEDRLEHQLQGRLHDPVTRGRDAKPTELPVTLGDRPLAHTIGLKPPGLQIIPKLGQPRARVSDPRRDNPIDAR